MHEALSCDPNNPNNSKGSSSAALFQTQQGMDSWRQNMGLGWTMGVYSNLFSSGGGFWAEILLEGLIFYFSSTRLATRIEPGKDKDFLLQNIHPLPGLAF